MTRRRHRCLLILYHASMLWLAVILTVHVLSLHGIPFRPPRLMMGILIFGAMLLFVLTGCFMPRNDTRPAWAVYACFFLYCLGNGVYGMTNLPGTGAMLRDGPHMRLLRTKVYIPVSMQRLLELEAHTLRFFSSGILALHIIGVVELWRLRHNPGLYDVLLAESNAVQAARDAKLRAEDEARRQRDEERRRQRALEEAKPPPRHPFTARQVLRKLTRDRHLFTVAPAFHYFLNPGEIPGVTEQIDRLQAAHGGSACRLLDALEMTARQCIEQNPEATRDDVFRSLTESLAPPDCNRCSEPPPVPSAD